MNNLVKIFMPLFILGLQFGQLKAQFGRSYGGASEDYGYETEATPDGGFVIAGLTQSYGAGSSDYWVLKFDSLGNKEWAQPFGTTSYEQIYSLRLTVDSGYLIGGYSGIPGPNQEGALMYKVNSHGQMVWTKLIHLLTYDHCHALFENYEGGYYMAGHTESTGTPSGAMWVVKMDSARNVIWDSSYTTIYTSQHAHAAALTPDSGLIVLGHTDEFTYTNFRLLKLNKNGNTQWAQVYRSGSTNNDTPLEIRVTKEGNYAMFGYTDSQTTSQFWLLVVDTLGNELMNKHYGTGQNYLWSGRQTTDGGFIMIGYRAGGIYGGTEEMIIYKTDPSGNLQWTKEYGGPGTDEGYGLAAFHQNKYVFVGGTYSFSTGGGEDVWVIVTDTAGNITTYSAVPNDAGIVKIISPVGNDCSLNFDTKMVLLNAGLDTLQSVLVCYQLDTNQIDTLNWIGSLPSLATDTIVLANNTSSNGRHSFRAWTALPNDSVDINPANDTSFASFTLDTSRASTPFRWGFENDTLLSYGWTTKGVRTLLTVDTPGGFGNSNFSMKANFFHVPLGTQQYISPIIDLTGLTLPVTLEFSVAYPQTGSETNHYRDTLRVNISNDCGNTWTNLYTKADTKLATNAITTSQFSPAPNQWRREQVDLDSFAGQLVQLNFEAKSGNGNNLFIDDINISNDSIVIYTGLVNTTGVMEMTVYPNPAANNLMVKLQRYQPGTEISLINTLGEELYRRTVESSAMSIDISGILPGMYLLKASNNANNCIKKVTIIK